MCVQASVYACAHLDSQKAKAWPCWTRIKLQTSVLDTILLHEQSGHFLNSGYDLEYGHKHYCAAVTLSIIAPGTELFSKEMDYVKGLFFFFFLNTDRYNSELRPKGTRIPWHRQLEIPLS